MITDLSVFQDVMQIIAWGFVALFAVILSVVVLVAFAVVSVQERDAVLVIDDGDDGPDL